MANLALEASRADSFNVRRSNVFGPTAKIEIRFVTDKGDALYDERIERGATDRELIESLKDKGQLVPALGFKDPGEVNGKQIVWMIDGRQRWMHLQQAWTEMLAAGVDEGDLPPFRIMIKRYGSNIEKFEAGITANAHRWNDSPVVSARKIEAYLNLIGDDAQGRERARKLFALKSLTVLENMRKLNNLTPEIQAKIAAGEMTASGGLQLAHLNPAQQAAAVSNIKKGATVEEIRGAGREAAGKKATPKVLSRTSILDRITTLRQELAAARSDTKIETLKARIEELHFVLGER